MSVDPRLNCASEVCCAPNQDGTYNTAAHSARVGILIDLGIPEEMSHKVSKAMTEKGLCFMPQQLADVIREVAFPAKD